MLLFGLDEFRYVALLGVLIAGCGGSGTGEPPECVEGVCPCTEAGVRAAVAEGGAFTFDCEGPTTVTTGREIVIENDVTLDGEGNLTLDANQRHRLLSVREGVTVELIGLAIANGNQVEGNGGGVLNEGTLTLTNSTISGSSAGRDSGCITQDPQLLCAEGGGIWNAGTLTLMKSTVSGNAAHFGGGLANRGGSVRSFDSSFTANSAAGCRSNGGVVCSGGGGIWNSGAVAMSNSSVSDSTADWGAGIYNRQVLTLSESIVFENSAGFDGGGLLSFGTVELLNTTVADNSAGQSGGGVANPAPGLLEVRNSTLSGNTATAAGGGVYNPAGATADLVNTTVSGNVANMTGGGGVYTGGELTLFSCTLAENQAPSGTSILDAATSTQRTRLIANTLVEGDCDGPPFESGGHNVESPGDTCGFDQGTDQPAEADLDLGPLEDNGGPTRTHALFLSSVALDQIPELECLDFADEPLSTDQRGEPRPAGPRSACDVGAFELQP